LTSVEQLQQHYWWKAGGELIGFSLSQELVTTQC